LNKLGGPLPLASTTTFCEKPFKQLLLSPPALRIVPPHFMLAFMLLTKSKRVLDNALQTAQAGLPVALTSLIKFIEICKKKGGITTAQANELWTSLEPHLQKIARAVALLSGEIFTHKVLASMCGQQTCVDKGLEWADLDSTLWTRPCRSSRHTAINLHTSSWPVRGPWELRCLGRITRGIRFARSAARTRAA
jgi:hypothetical protein